MPADAVRGDPLEHRRGVRARRGRASGAGDARLRVDDDVVRLDQVGERQEREQRGRRVAAGVGDEPTRRGEELRQRVAPVGERRGVRVVEPVPLLVRRGILQPVPAREVDDDARRRRLERGRLAVAEAHEDDVGAGCQRVRVPHEAGQPGNAEQPRIEGGRRLPGMRVRAERDEPEARMGEHAVQGLLAGVPAPSDDRGGCHLPQSSRAAPLPHRRQLRIVASENP
jgi:hypothetical protein